jgi:ADP-dependent NAD(P)H-hydrate dehydratase / NAD(P)H-hydrate epimerase
VRAVLEARVPVVLDAGALTVVAEDADVRAAIADRASRGLPTVLTPHEGEFERMQPGLLAALGRLDAARAAASALGAVIVLKGPGTVIVDPDGTAFVDTEGTADLGTAGSGDVLTGVVAAVLAGAWADGVRVPASLTEATAAAVWLHGRAGREAAVDAPVTAPDVAAAVPAAIRIAREGDS